MLPVILAALDNLELHHWNLFICNSAVFEDGGYVCLNFILESNFKNFNNIHGTYRNIFSLLLDCDVFISSNRLDSIQNIMGM